MESKFHCSFQLEKVSRFVISDFNECTLHTTCDANAQCTNSPEDFSFLCKCDNGYEGDGFTCVKIVTSTVEECKILLNQDFCVAPEI